MNLIDSIKQQTIEPGTEYECLAVLGVYLNDPEATDIRFIFEEWYIHIDRLIKERQECPTR